MSAEVPIISVLMSVYKEPLSWINESVYSILNQTFADFEFIIVDDNPPNKELNEYLIELTKRDSRVKILFNPTNIGLTKSLNKGLKKCRGRYIARMDADDWAYPNRFKKQFEFMESNPEIIASSAMAYSWKGNDSLTPIFRPTEYDHIIPYSFTSSPFIHPLLIMRRDKLLENNIYYDENFPRSQDYKLAVDLIQYGKIANLPDYLLKYRISSQQVTSKFGNEQVELCKKIRRQYVDDFYSKYNFGVLDKEVTLNTILHNKKIEEQYIVHLQYDKKAIREFRTCMNSIRRLLYYSLTDYSFKSLSNFVLSRDYFMYPYNLRRFVIVCLKHFKPDFIPMLL